MTAKPVPDVTDMNRVYWEGTAQGELRLLACNACGGVARFAQLWCPHCWSADLGHKVASGRGTVTNFTVVDYAPYPAFDDAVPYVLALIALEEGVTMMSNVVGIAPAEVRIGLPVRVRREGARHYGRGRRGTPRLGPSRGLRIGIPL